MVVLRGGRWRRPHNKRQQHRAVAALVRWTLNRCAFWEFRLNSQNAPLNRSAAGRYEVAPIFLMVQVFGSAPETAMQFRKRWCVAWPSGSTIFCLGQVKAQRNVGLIQSRKRLSGVVPVIFRFSSGN